MSGTVRRAVVAVLSLFVALSVPRAALCDPAGPKAPPASLSQGAKATSKPGASKTVKADKAKTSKIQEGDLVTINFTASTENGEVVRTTSEKVSSDPERRKSPYFSAGPAFAPEDLVAGRPGGSIPGLSEAVIGMSPGEKKKAVLQPDKAFGVKDPDKRKQLPCVSSMPRKVHMNPQDYVKDFHVFPVVGKEVPVTRYFKATVLDVTEQLADLECNAKDGDRFEEPFGSIEVKVDQENISVVLTPRLGSDFPMGGGRQGKIVATDGVNFTVDSNGPLAGMPITVELAIASVTKASELDSLQIHWVEDHDKGIAQAGKEGKPAVLVLYADWCNFSKRLFGETFQDPRVRVLKDRFVWVKVNSDSQQKYKEKYAQNGFPLIVILNSEGSPLARLEGFRDAAGLHNELVKISKPL
jgi:FKBP-type peptidyl-prolyl cis-trans isomerase 2